MYIPIYSHGLFLETREGSLSPNEPVSSKRIKPIRMAETCESLDKDIEYYSLI